MPTNKNTIFLDECTPEEILKIISELENGKSSDVPIRVIKKSAHVISGILGQYFNILMAEGVFPDVLKTGRVTPIFKKGNPEDIGNYRPVSTLPIFGKILEKIIYSRIYNFSLSTRISLGSGSHTPLVMLLIYLCPSSKTLSKTKNMCLAYLLI